MTSLNLNWYDFAVLVALLYGIWSGIRMGLSGEIIRVLGLLAMIWLSVELYETAGSWIAAQTGWEVDLANLAGFVGIAVVVYIIALLIRKLVHRQTQKMKFAAFVENLGGGVAGFLRMVVIMALLTVVLTLVRSPFWHEQVARKSKFGAFVVQQIPAVAAAAQKQFPEKMWFLNDLKRRREPGIDEGSSASTNKPR